MIIGHKTFLYFCGIMIYDWHNIKDLRKASIFNLTDDIEIIRECTCLPDLTMADRERYESELDDAGRVGDYEAFNHFIGFDEEFKKAVHAAFSDLYQKINTLPEGKFWE